MLLKRQVISTPEGSTKIPFKPLGVAESVEDGVYVVGFAGSESHVLTGHRVGESEFSWGSSVLGTVADLLFTIYPSSLENLEENWEAKRRAEQGEEGE
jgi:hypothetical protein